MYHKIDPDVVLAGSIIGGLVFLAIMVAAVIIIIQVYTCPKCIRKLKTNHHPEIGDSHQCESDLPLPLAEREAHIVLEGNNLVHPAQASCPPSQEAGLQLQENASYQPFK